MLVAAVDLGVFDGVQSLGPCRVEALAEHLEASPLPLQHLLDALVTFGFLDQVEDVYELTETAERYLCTNGAASMASLVHVAPGPLENWTHLADTIRTGSAVNPIENDPAAFYGPLVQATFATQFRAATRLGFRLGWTRRPALRVLDLGAGRAPWSLALLEQSPGSTAVVNDLDAVMPLAESMIAERGVEDRVEVRPGDFHQIDIEPESFDVVMLGHVCRTEGDEAAAALVRRAFAALRPGGQVVLADYFADNTRKYNPFGVQMGITMLANTRHGGLITYEQVREWLADAGFEFIRVIEPIGFNQVFVASRPER